LQYASNAAFQFGTGDFTIEFWWYPTTLASAQVLVYHTDDSGVVGVGEFVIVYNTSVGLRFYINNNQVDVQQGSTSGWSANSWYHIAAVRNGNTLTLYRNGTSIASGSVSGVTIGAAVVTQLMGETYDPLYSTGYFSNYRVVKGTAVYTAAFTPPSAPLTAITNTSLLLNYTNAGIYDATSKNDLETVGNAQISTTQSKFGGSSMYFDGTGDYLSAKNNPALQLGSGDFTVEFWLYANSSSANHGLVASDQTGSGYWAILIASNTIYWQNVNGSSNLFSTRYSSYYNQWVHVAFVRYSGTTKLYLNGAYIAGAADSSNYNGAAGAYDVGRDVDNGAYLTGYINDLRVTKGIARYTSNFTPPTTAFPVL
jgi:hypothetical protein